jgi:cytochrome c oxidase cbb3-type subunit I/II
VPVYQAARLSKKAPAETLTEVSDLEPVPVLNAAKRLDVWSRMNWHRRWERLPVRFTLLTTLAVVIASLFEIVPTFLIRSNVPTIATVKPYTPLELAGRDIYVSEGCYNCHSQMVRPMVAETKRYGEYSKPGEFIYDHPFQWGSRRIGPDLAREGGKQSSIWHWEHFDDPQRLNEDSVMPSYAHLLDTKINFKRIPDRVHAAHMLGAPYDRELKEAVEMAKQQAEQVAADIVSQGGTIRRGDVMTFDSQAVALIAYIQRLGTDIFASPEPTAEELAAAAEIDATEIDAAPSESTTPDAE